MRTLEIRPFCAPQPGSEPDTLQSVARGRIDRGGHCGGSAARLVPTPQGPLHHHSTAVSPARSA
jgi:hypothetical protein